MTDAEKLAKLKLKIDPDKTWSTTEESLLTSLLDDAKNNIIEWRYGLCSALPSSLPSSFDNIQIESALIDYNLMGMENETSHRELEISRTNKYTNSMDYIRDHVIAFAGL